MNTTTEYIELNNNTNHEGRNMSDIKYKVMNNGTVQITSGISCFEVINPDNGETVAGNAIHVDAVREMAIAIYKGAVSE